MTQTKIDQKVKNIIAYMENAIPNVISYKTKYDTIKEIILN